MLSGAVPGDGRRQLGRDGEMLAQHYLEQRGYRLVESNFSCREGEIDLIMRQGNTLVFVEVRGRSTDRPVSPQETVDARKQEKLRRAARQFLYRHPELGDCYCRFDVLALLWQGEGTARAAAVEWYPDAFR